MPSVMNKFLYNSKKTTFIFEGCISEYPTNRGEKMNSSYSTPPVKQDTSSHNISDDTNLILFRIKENQGRQLMQAKKIKCLNPIPYGGGL